jgi:hypothetical protein
MANGFAKLGIPLSHQELERVWKAIVEGGETKQDKIDYKLFKLFYEKNYQPRNTMNNNQTMMGTTQMGQTGYNNQTGYGQTNNMTNPNQQTGYNNQTGYGQTNNMTNPNQQTGMSGLNNNTKNQNFNNSGMYQSSSNVTGSQFMNMNNTKK